MTNNNERNPTSCNSVFMPAWGDLVGIKFSFLNLVSAAWTRTRFEIANF